MYEKTLVICKPEAYARGLVGTILARFEQRGLALEAARVSHGESDIVEQHYPRTEAWLEAVGQKTLDDYARIGISPMETAGTDDPIVIGRTVRKWLTEYLLSGPVVPMIMSGNRAIETVRKIVGHTMPVSAAPGTIRGDFSSDSADLANHEKRPVQNLIHASGDTNEAVREIKLWFPGSYDD